MRDWPPSYAALFPFLPARAEKQNDIYTVWCPSTMVKAFCLCLFFFFCGQKVEDRAAGCEEERRQTRQWQIPSAHLRQVPGAHEHPERFLQPVQDVQTRRVSQLPNRLQRLLAVQRLRQRVVRVRFLCLSTRCWWFMLSTIWREGGCFVLFA